MKQVPSLYEKFQRMCKDEFGYTVIKDPTSTRLTVKDVLGMSLKEIQELNNKDKEDS